MAKKPSINISVPGGAPVARPFEPISSSAAATPDDRVALTVKVDPHLYERLLIIKARRREPLQRWLERIIQEAVDHEGA